MTENRDLAACCFTGHRSIPFAHRPKLRELLFVAVRELYERGCREFLSGGALGFDILAAEVVLNFKKNCPDARLIMVLPCRDQDKMWNNADKIRYKRVLDAADEAVFLCETYCTGCMHLRNKNLVENSRFCIAYYSHRGGGTEYTVKYAREKELEIINLAYMM